MPLKNTLAILLLVLSAFGRLAVSAEQTEPNNTTLLPVFFTAIRNGDLDGMQQILKEHPEQIHARDERGWTPLMLAAFYADADCVGLCIESGAEVNAINNHDATALHFAASDLIKVRLLIDAGADVNAKTTLGTTPLMLAAGHREALPIVKLLLNNGADASAKNERPGGSALEVASRMGHLDAVKSLLERDEQPKLNESLGIAGAFGHRDVAKLLIDSGADVNVRPFKPDLMSPLLTIAAHRNHVDVAGLLLDHGAEVNSPDDSALFWAVDNENGNEELVKRLLKCGADAHEEYGDGWGPQMGTPYTPLMVTKRKGQTANVEALLAAGAKDVQDPWSLEKKNPRKMEHPSETPLQERLLRSVTTAVPLLQHTALETLPVFETHGFQCVSCHNQGVSSVAIKLAKEKGVPYDSKMLDDFLLRMDELGDANVDLASSAEPEMGNPGAELLGFLFWGTKLSPAKIDIASDVSVHRILLSQARDGSWPNGGSRPPIIGSRFTATALAVRAILSSPLPGRRAEINKRLQLARGWLADATPHTTEDSTFKLLGAFWTGDSKENIAALADEILAMQKPDGGWAQLPSLQSDAYATGQVLFALQEAARFTPKHPRIARGLAFLVDDQCADGSWFVRRRAYPLQPTMDPKFPHGRDAWISAAGTSWAVMALTVGLEKQEVADVLARNKELAVPKPYVQPKKELPPVANVRIDYEKHILPILETSCLGCHSSDDPAGKYAMDSRDALKKGGYSGPPVVIPGNSADSLLIHHVADQIQDVEMPPLAHRDDYEPLTAEQIGLLRAWIEQGVPWSEGEIEDGDPPPQSEE